MVNDTAAPAEIPRVPRNAWIAIVMILVVIALVSIHANLERAHRNEIETAIVTPAKQTCRLNATPCFSNNQNALWSKTDMMKSLSVAAMTLAVLITAPAVKSQDTRQADPQPGSPGPSSSATAFAISFGGSER